MGLCNFSMQFKEVSYDDHPIGKISFELDTQSKININNMYSLTQIVLLSITHEHKKLNFLTTIFKS